MAKATPSNVLSVVSDSAESPTPVASPYESGVVIAEKYQLSSVIGEGGMGSVWRARNLLLHVDVAIKLIHSELASDEADQRLLTEARSAAQLRHPAIVSVHDFGITDHGDPYIVMELLEGESLGDVVDRKGSLSATKGVQMLLPIVGALATAHGKGIVHRDIKPDNVILLAEESGRVLPKIVDFGIAKVEQPAPLAGKYGQDGPVSRSGARLTQAGRLVGSPGYMSPEQASGSSDVDERADLWSLSVVLYETIVGEPPFETPDLEETLIRVLVEAPTPITVLGVGDEGLWQIIERGLRKDRDQRWQSADEMGQALAQWLLDQGVETDIAGTSLRQNWLKASGDDYRPLSDSPSGPVSGRRASSRDAPFDENSWEDADLGALEVDDHGGSGKSRRGLLVALVALVAAGAIFVLASPNLPGAKSAAPDSSAGAATTAAPTPTTEAETTAAAAEPSAAPTASASASPAESVAAETAPPTPRLYRPRRPKPKDEPKQDEPEAATEEEPPAPPPPPKPKPKPKDLTVPEVPNF